MEKLTKRQMDVYNLLKQEITNTKTMAIMLRLSERRIRSIKQSLKKSGYTASAPHVSISTIPPPPQVSDGTWRYHALHFVIEPYYFFPRYEVIRAERGNYGIYHRDWRVKLHPGLVEIQLKQEVDFTSKDKWEATRKAEISFNRILHELSSIYGFEVWKEGKANIRLVNQHLALNGSTLAEEHGEFLQIRGKDGKVFFVIDNSKGYEHEYRSASRAISDSERMEPYFNDMRDKQPPKLSELSLMLGRVIKQNEETAAGLAIITKLMLPQVEEAIDTPKVSRPSYIG